MALGKKNSVWIRYSLLALGAAAVIALVVSMIMGFMSQKGKPRKPPVQQIAIMRPPPPPPPPKQQQEKPPEVKKEEVKLPPPPQEQAPKDAGAKEAGKDLGVDAEGGAGGDGFGLVGRKGGRDLLAGDGGGGRSAFAFYTNMLQQQIQDELSRNRKLKGGDYRAVVRIWLAADGRMQKVDLAGSTGNAEVDSNLRSALAEMVFRQPPPQNMPQPVRLRISSRGAG